MCSALWLLVGALCGTATVFAAPLYDPHVGGVGWGGPTTGDLAAVYWNPGALALITGNQVMVGGTLRLRSSTFDPATAGGGPVATARGQGTYQPVTWPPGPGTFVAVGADLGGRFAIALAAYMPFAQKIQYDEAGDATANAPTSFHVVQADLRNAALVPALAFRIGGDWRVGVAPGFMFSTGRLSFDQRPAAPVRHDLRSDSALFNSTPAFTVGAGIHYQRGTWELGLAYASRPLGTDSDGVQIDSHQTRISNAPGSAAPALAVCPAGGPTDCVFGRLFYRLPDTFTVGVTRHVSPRWDMTGIFRWTTWSRHERLTLRFVGPASGGLQAAGLPEQVALYRGFRDSFEARARLVGTFGPKLRLAATLRAETSAIPTAAVNPAAIDGVTIEPALAIQIKVLPSLLLAAGYALSLMPPVTVAKTVFDPAAATTCQASGDNLANPACQTRQAGAARPSAAGTYHQLGQSFSLTATALF